MLTFKPVAQRDLSRLRRYYKNCNYQLCEYSALVKLMWRGHLRPQYAEAAGCLIVKNCIDGHDFAGDTGGKESFSDSDAPIEKEIVEFLSEVIYEAMAYI